MYLNLIEEKKNPVETGAAADAAASSHTTHVITVSQSGDGESGMAIEKKENGRWIGDQRDAILWG